MFNIVQSVISKFSKMQTYIGSRENRILSVLSPSFDRTSTDKMPTSSPCPILSTDPDITIVILKCERQNGACRPVIKYALIGSPADNCLVPKSRL